MEKVHREYEHLLATPFEQASRCVFVDFLVVIFKSSPDCLNFPHYCVDNCLVRQPERRTTTWQFHTVLIIYALEFVKFSTSGWRMREEFPKMSFQTFGHNRNRSERACWLNNAQRLRNEKLLSQGIIPSKQQQHHRTQSLCVWRCLSVAISIYRIPKLEKVCSYLAVSVDGHPESSTLLNLPWRSKSLMYWLFVDTSVVSPTIDDQNLLFFLHHLEFDRLDVRWWAK